MPKVMKAQDFILMVKETLSNASFQQFKQLVSQYKKVQVMHVVNLQRTKKNTINHITTHYCYNPDRYIVELIQGLGRPL